MDRNQFTGLILIMLILLGWSYLTAPSKEEIAERQRIQDSIKIAQTEQKAELDNPKAFDNVATPQNTLSDSAQVAQLEGTYGDFAQAAVGSEETYTLENELISITFTNKGGRIKEAILKQHKKLIDTDTEVDIPTDLKLLENDKNRFEYLLPVGRTQISTEDLYFTAEQNGSTIRFTAPAGNGSVEQVYTLLPDSYKVDYDVKFSNLQNTISRDQNNIRLNWKNHLDKLEKNVNFEKFYSTAYYKLADDDTDYCSCRGDDSEDLSEDKLDWVSHVNQFFNTSLIAKNGAFVGGKMDIKMAEEDASYIKTVQTNIGIPYNHSANEAFAMQMYIGPNEFKRLSSFNTKLEEVIPFGNSIFGTINRRLIRPFFNWLSTFIGSKGIVIIVLIFIIKMILYPLMYKMLHSQALMGVLKPEITKRTEKFADDPQKKQLETMKMYREYGVSPLGGCMPMIVQMPIWYALFRFFPASITFRQEPFLWANDLSSYDVFFNLPFNIPMIGAHISLFTVLWAVSTLLYTYYNTRHMDMSANPAMKYVQYFMPLMFLGFFNTYASGLTCYMFFSNLFNILQTVVTKKFVFKDEKLKAELQQRKNAPKKPKSGLGARFEEAMKQQQAAAAKAKKSKK